MNRQVKHTDYKFDDDSVSQAAAFIADRLNRVFAHYLCVIEFFGDKDADAPPSLSNFRQLSIYTIQGACFHESLLALRDIDDVFSDHPKYKDDDIRTKDFGYHEKLSFLTTTERDAINKGIAHSTTFGIAYHPNFDIYELISKCISQTNVFLDWLEINRDWSSAIFIRHNINSTYERIRDELKKNQLLKTI